MIPWNSIGHLKYGSRDSMHAAPEWFAQMAGSMRKDVSLIVAYAAEASDRTGPIKSLRAATGESA
jgi:hypothetical protein